MSGRTLPTVWHLRRGQRERTHCVWCGQKLGDDAVPAGTAVGYWGAHNLSVPVDSCPPCASVDGETPPSEGPQLVTSCADRGRPSDKDRE